MVYGFLKWVRLVIFVFYPAGGLSQGHPHPLDQTRLALTRGKKRKAEIGKAETHGRMSA
jgi:hypothetical protein